MLHCRYATCKILNYDKCFTQMTSFEQSESENVTLVVSTETKQQH